MAQNETVTFKMKVLLSFGAVGVSVVSIVPLLFVDRRVRDFWWPVVLGTTVFTYFILAFDPRRRWLRAISAFVIAVVHLNYVRFSPSDLRAWIGAWLVCPSRH